mmetsp:Transcript_26109/g.32627  ORF Transcript_26109/g.32627 Transcript_26109/m.32627 type:complete len:295 (+) Transcript_26109:19-903(+)|eukprot:CAMPEP_0170451540 /NCGR_PEP_ID=MMETSP0123-20130129/747_1 /TAXON_ID=182087 /ORGANISM="Favella ehrenbergii, Strain Fehren 1" /LENGTH=294 /DNA_ID=CAMNT_0010713265 /DNA_START=6 /DNA_END=890 /DNA_ORIENTATION=-
MICTLVYTLIVIGIVYKAYQHYLWATCSLDFSGKTIFISGGSSGIGEALTKRLIGLGAKKIIIAARRQEELDRVKKECASPERVQTFTLDLGSPEEVMKKCEKFFAGEEVDIVINNGGISMRECFEDIDFSVCTRMMNVNALSHIAVCKAALPGMISRKRGGHFCNILSISGYMGAPLRSMYVSSKFALSGFGKVLRAETRQHGIDVTQVYPSYVQTNISKNALLGDGRAFGKTDPNIAKGMPVEKCVTQILKSIKLGIAEMSVGGTGYKVIYHLGVYLPQQFTDFLSDKVLKK